MVFLMIVHLMVSQSFAVSTPQCHHCEQTFCNCSGHNLGKVPAIRSELITELDLSYNSLGSIMKDDFLAYASLRSLAMNNNRIKTIHGEAFVPLINLEKLDLSFNQLDALSSGWFKNLFSLRYLNLLGNKYTRLGQGNLFQPLKRLKILHIGGPSLQFVNKRDFSGLFALEELFFDGRNLRVFANESLKQIGPIGHVTLNLNDVFQRNLVLVAAILSDLAHPNITLAFTDTLFFTMYQMVPLKVACDLGTTSVLFKNVNMSVSACIALLNVLASSHVTMLTLENTQFFLNSESGFLDLQDKYSLETIIFKNVNIAWFYRFPALNFLQPLMKGVRRASMLNSKVFAIPCESSTDLANLEFLDVSGNFLTDIALDEMMCGGNGVFESLQTINISKNHLQSIESQLFTKLEKLMSIDMSGNKFQNMPETCSWPASLQFLNLSSSHLTKVTPCLPASLRILDLSNNELTVFNIELQFLTELYISGNKIGNLPDGRLYPHLVFLSIQNNELLTFSSNNLHDYKNLKSLQAGGNTYVCSCDFVDFMKRDLMNHRVTIGDEFKSYICDSPDAVRGKGVADVKLSVFECYTVLAVFLLCLGILMLCLLIAGLCYKFSFVWYMKMTWAWLKAKRKPKLKKGVLEYDAFVSYSEMDSGWVEAHLIPALEESEPPLRLCLHKRDFVPGGWIVDNIMDAIEKSHRTLFILSHHFVRSEWCKYELDYTHFRLFDQNDDAVVLILLEPIDHQNIPKRFCRLRRVMNSRTYLEWPDDDKQIFTFWQSLRAALKRSEADDETVDL